MEIGLSNQVENATETHCSGFSGQDPLWARGVCHFFHLVEVFCSGFYCSMSSFCSVFMARPHRVTLEMNWPSPDLYELLLDRVEDGRVPQ